MYINVVSVSILQTEAFQNEDPSDCSARFRTPVGGSLMLPSQDGPRPMAIFELLEYIVNQPAPNLPDSTFSGDFLLLTISLIGYFKYIVLIFQAFLNPNISLAAEFRDFILNCLQKDPSQRGDLKALVRPNPWIVI